MLLWRKMMDKMNTNNFKILVEALEALPASIKNNKVDMQSNFEPACGTAGCLRSSSLNLFKTSLVSLYLLELCSTSFISHIEFWKLVNSFKMMK
jgi:hypothetical protein